MVLEHLVEPDRDVDRWRAGGLVLDGEVAEQRPRRDGYVPHAPFHEVAGRGGLWEHHQVHRRIELRDLRQHAADLLQVGVIVALGGAKLRDGEARHSLKIGRQATTGGKGGSRRQSGYGAPAALCRPLPPITAQLSPYATTSIASAAATSVGCARAVPTKSAAYTAMNSSGTQGKPGTLNGADPSRARRRNSPITA